MIKRYYFLLAACSATFGFTAPALAQANNDGFQRRNGQMYVVRNGQPRPMTHDVHLPTGTVVTKDGFLVAPNGQRAELREGQGCTLRGQPVDVVQGPTGLVLAAPQTRAAERAREMDEDDEPERGVEAVFSRLFGEREGKGWKKAKGRGKRHGKGHGEDD